MLLIIAMNNLRWSLLLRGQGINFDFWKALPLTFIGQFFNYAVPGGVGGDVVKGYYLVQGKKGGRIAPLMTIAMDRLIGLWAMAFLALVGFLTNWSYVVEYKSFAFMFVSVLGLFGGFTLAIYFAFAYKPERFRKRFDFLHRLPKGGAFFTLYNAFHDYSKKPLLILQAFVISIGAQMLSILFIWIIGHNFEPQLGVLAYFFIVPISFMAMAVPISPAGIGVGQAVLFFLFNLALGHKSQLGPNSITIFQITMFLWSLPGVYFYLRRGQPVREMSRVG